MSEQSCFLKVRFSCWLGSNFVMRTTIYMYSWRIGLFDHFAAPYTYIFLKTLSLALFVMNLYGTECFGKGNCCRTPFFLFRLSFIVLVDPRRIVCFNLRVKESREEIWISILFSKNTKADKQLIIIHTSTPFKLEKLQILYTSIFRSCK